MSLRRPDGSAQRLKVRSMGWPAAPVRHYRHRALAAAKRVPRAVEIMFERLRRMPELLDSIHATGPGHFGYGERGMVCTCE